MTRFEPSMAQLNNLKISYDRHADVLYISTIGDAGEDARFDRLNGILWRYTADGEVVGATVMDFWDRWSHHRDDLSTRLSQRFHLPAPQANQVVEQAVSVSGHA